MPDSRRRSIERGRKTGPVVRRGTLRLPLEAAARVRAGHPWVYREAIGGRPLQERSGDSIDLVDPSGEFLGRGLYDEEAIIALRVFTRRQNEQIGPELVRRRVAAAVALRRRFLPADLDAHRLVNGESDGLPGIAVDRYGDFIVVQLFTPAVLPLRDALLDAIEAEVAPKGIYEQRRLRSLAGDAPRPGELVRGAAVPVEIEVREDDLRFWVDPSAPLSPGLFLDLREGRRSVRRWAQGRRVLNLFSYTGAITVAAKKGGATELVAVDVSAKAHARARRNLQASGLDPEGPEHVVGDAAKVVARFAERSRRFDLVVLDPPAFGTGGKGQIFSAAQDYKDLVAAVLELLVPGGLLIAASGTHKISHEDFDRILAEGAARAEVDLRVVERQGLPLDFPVTPGFPEGSYLKFAVAVRD